MVSVVGKYLLWLGNGVDLGQSFGWVWFFGRRPEGVGFGYGEEDECYASPIGGTLVFLVQSWSRI